MRSAANVKQHLSIARQNYMSLSFPPVPTSLIRRDQCQMMRCSSCSIAGS